jgi:hypothetical protein
MKAIALSLKQPWATLLVHGHKMIEVRKWPTPKRGLILIHAARVPDPRPEAWEMVPQELREHAALGGGIIGSANLTDCIRYREVRAFAADRALHLNPPEWYQPPVLYGFVFRDAAVLPFRPFPGWMRFFEVGQTVPHKKRGA